MRRREALVAVGCVVGLAGCNGDLLERELVNEEIDGDERYVFTFNVNDSIFVTVSVDDGDSASIAIYGPDDDLLTEETVTSEVTIEQVVQYGGEYVIDVHTDDRASVRIAVE